MKFVNISRYDVDDEGDSLSDENDPPHGLFSSHSGEHGPFIDRKDPHDLHVIIHLLNE